MHRLKHGLGSMGLALALAAGPLRAQGAFDFGLGLETLFDHQESLDLASMHTTVTVRDSGGGGSVTEIPGDPALLNRKFDFLSELQGEGAQGSIALPTLGLVRPTFYWQALSADLRLDFLDRPEPTESTSLEGRGLLFGAGFELAIGLCTKCGWLASAGYLVHDMPSFDADRKPRLFGDGLSNDRVRVRRRVSDASFRIAYSPPGARIIPYTGVRRRSTDLDIEDDLAFRGPGPDGTSEETRLKTRIKIKGDATLAVAGLDVKFGGNLFGRLETAIGDGDRVVEVKLVYLWSKPTTKTTPTTTPTSSDSPTSPTFPTFPTSPTTTSKDYEKMKERAGEIAREIAPQLAALKAKLLGRWPEDPKAREDFLDQACAEIERILAAPELAAARDYVFRDFPNNRPPAPAAASLPPAHGMALAAFRPNSSAARAAEPPGIVDRLLQSLAASVSLLLRYAEAEDLLISLCAAPSPGQRGTFELWPASYLAFPKQPIATPGRLLVYRGLYAYHAASGSYRPIGCIRDIHAATPPECLRLDLMTDSGPGLLCEFDLGLCSLKPKKPKGCSG